MNDKVFVLICRQYETTYEYFYAAARKKEKLKELICLFQNQIENNLIDINDNCFFEIKEVKHELSDNWFSSAKTAIENDVQVTIDILYQEIETEFELSINPILVYNKRNSFEGKENLLNIECSWHD